MKKVILLSMLAALPALAIGTNGATGNVTVVNANVSSGTATTGSTVALPMTSVASNMYSGADDKMSTVGIQVSGTFVGTLTFQSSFDNGVTWVSHAVVVAPLPTSGATGTQVTTATSTGNWYASVGGVTHFRVTCTAYTSGTAVVTLEKGVGQQLVTIQAMPPLSAGTAALGTVTAVGAAAAGTAISGNPVQVGGSDGTNARALLTDTGGRQVVIGAAATGSALTGNPVLVAGSDGTNAQTLRVQADNSTAANGATVLPGRYDASLRTLTNGNVAGQALDVNGRALIAGSAADDAAISGNPVPIGVKAIAVAAQPSAVTAGDVAYPVASLERILYVNTFHPNLVSCNVAVSTATTLTAVGGSCAAPGASLSLYVTDITFGSSAASSTAADSFPTLKYGTGGTCGTGTAVAWSAMTEANTTVAWNGRTPIRIPANSELCWIHSGAGSKVIHVVGFIAP